jgi:hypothetical protein
MIGWFFFGWFREKNACVNEIRVRVNSLAPPPDVRKVFDLPKRLLRGGLCPSPGDSIQINRQWFIVCL